ncbi:MAG: NAD(P)-dependent oxidoreductase [Gemmatimonadetes bacterium]|jgi:nucleoside-diphosphate-sugar epimerase|nr:NAD(P)-dependent oxidoreductase [Gemmatimonadota bacterium]
MKVAVIGAAGWVGRAVLKSFAERHQVKAFDFNPEAWDVYRRFDGDWEGEKHYGDVADFSAVDSALEGMDGVVNLSAYFGYEEPPEDEVKPFLINVKGMWNVLEVARRRGLKRVVQMGSCVVQHPDGRFLSSEVRSKEGNLYGITKRLQEEVCRQYHDAYGLRIIIFRPCSIGDSKLGISRDGNPARGGVGWVCRHDLAEACHLALENETIDFDIMHTASHPDADKYCNTARSREILGLEYKGHFPGD